MRKIKLRAYDKEKKVMVFSDTEIKFAKSIYQDGYNFCSDDNGEIRCFFSFVVNEDSDRAYDDLYTLDNIMQCTDIRDINTRNIYEGDIVDIKTFFKDVSKEDDLYTGEICYNDRYASFGLKKIKKNGEIIKDFDEFMPIMALHVTGNEELEIIGNIYTL